MAGVLALLALLAGPPADAAYMIPGGTIRPKDFTLVKKDGIYHLFYIRHNTAVPFDSTENDFGHATSNDLFHWFQQPPILASQPDHWDNAHVWAPSIVESDGLYWMFYTGVSTVPGEYNQTQQLGIAVSSDLWNWTWVGGPFYQSTYTSWSPWRPLDPALAFRDPFVMRDPAHPGYWLMYYTATYAADTAATVVGVATADADLTVWEDVKPLLITWRDYTYNQLTESPHVFEHDGRWFLFITTSAGQPLSYYSSPNPVGDPAEWIYHGRLRNMLGFDTSTWFASEYFREGTRELFTCVNGDRIEIREMRWTTPTTFSLVQPPLLHVLDARWERPTVWSNEQAALKMTLANPLAGQLDLELLAVDSTGVETVVPPDSVGFNSSPTVWTDTSYVAWVARRWPAVPDSDTVTVSRFRVRTADQTAMSDIVTVGGPRPPTAPSPPLPDSVPPPPDPEPQPIDWFSRPVSLRSLDSTPLGGGPALAVEMPAAGPARVDVFDLSGRRLRTLADREFPKGLTVLTWDGRDAGGRTLPRGLYFARLLGPGVRATARMLIVPR